LIELAPSILSADFAHLADHVQRATEGGATLIHVDIMDGHFVPNLTIGPPVVKSLRKVTKLPLDCHLMVENADEFIPAFVEAGANWVSVHQEACVHLDRTLHHIREHGALAGVVINPATPASVLEEILVEVEQVLVMTVNPGFGHQHFIHTTLPKIRRVRRMVEQLDRPCDVEVDGGIDATTAPLVVDAGANVLVAGSAIFTDAESVAAAMKRLANAE